MHLRYSACCPGWSLAAWMLLGLLMIRCTDNTYNPPASTTNNGPYRPDTFALEYVKGNRQTFVGGQSTPDPLVFRIYHYRMQEHLAANSPEDARLDMFATGSIGQMSSDFDSFGNFCGDFGNICFGGRYFAPARDTAYELEIKVHIVHQVTGEHIQGSPFTMHHRILPKK